MIFHAQSMVVDQIDHDSPLVYRVDGRDFICFVNAQWDRFAVANDGQELVSNQIVQRSLWDFVSDETTRHLYEKMLARARAGTSIWFDFHCDSPCCRRLLRMHLDRVGSDEVEFRSQVLSSAARPTQSLLDRNTKRNEELLRMCGWCNRIQFAGQWLEVEQAVRRMNLFLGKGLPALTHGICERCSAQFLEIAES